VDELAQVFLRTEGDLLAVMGALLDHPAAWTAERAKVRPPIEFINAALRALDVSPESPADWVIPQAMAGRISWAMQAPEQFVPNLPDPRDFVRTALGDLAPQAVIFAAQSAEKRSDGIGVILASPAFQRR